MAIKLATDPFAQREINNLYTLHCNFCAQYTMSCASLCYILSFFHFSFLSLLPPFFSHPGDIHWSVSDFFFPHRQFGKCPFLSPQGPWWRRIHTSLVKLRHGQSSSPAQALLPAVFFPLASLTGTLFFSDSSSIGWASSLIGVAVCGWLGSVKESPERGTSWWMDSRVTAPGDEGWLLCIITAGKRETDSYTQ